MQAILHMAVGLGLVPATGVVLPLISYGRSHLVVTLASLGILMSISRASERPHSVGSGTRPLGRGMRPLGRRARA
jgi:cell division protein FtsW